jgi:hypothetical protein
MSVCIRIHVLVCVCVFAPVYVCVCASVWKGVCAYRCVRVCVRVCASVCEGLCASVCVRVCVHSYARYLVCARNALMTVSDKQKASFGTERRAHRRAHTLYPFTLRGVRRGTCAAHSATVILYVV